MCERQHCCVLSEKSHLKPKKGGVVTFIMELQLPAGSQGRGAEL